MTEHHVLNLGAGVQSTALYLMALRGEVRRFDVAIFADTQDEPKAVYAHLEWLKSLGGPEILIRSAGCLGDDLVHGRRSYDRAVSAPTKGGRFAAIPAFTTANGGVDVGMTRRQCSNEYKTEVIERAIRRDVCGLKPRQRVPKGVTVNQYFGISLDEASRATRIYERFHVTEESKFFPHFPLIDRMMTRANCLEWLAGYGVPHHTPRSACVYCPFHSDAEWQHLKDAGGPDWARLVQIDHALREPGTRATEGMLQVMFLHRTCKPIDEIEFKPRVNVKEQQLGFGYECEGVCGV